MANYHRTRQLPGAPVAGTCTMSAVVCDVGSQAWHAPKGGSVLVQQVNHFDQLTVTDQ